MITIQILKDENYWDWMVEGDDNSRGPYCGCLIAEGHDLQDVAIAVQQAMKDKARHPYSPRTRTEY